MFFVLSKTVGPSALRAKQAIEIGLIGLALLLTRFKARASRFMAESVFIPAVGELSLLVATP